MGYTVERTRPWYNYVGKLISLVSKRSKYGFVLPRLWGLPVSKRIMPRLQRGSSREPDKGGMSTRVKLSRSFETWIETTKLLKKSQKSKKTTHRVSREKERKASSPENGESKGPSEPIVNSRNV